VHGEQIAEIGQGDYNHNLEAAAATQKIDATGKIVIPGAIDAHVHFRDPGLTSKGDMSTESAAAVAGGVTSVLEMPNTVPQTTTLDALARKFDLAEGRMHTNYSFFLGATTDNLAEIKRYECNGGRLVKLFMGSSTGGMLVSDGRALSALFAEFGGVISVHCEDESIIRTNTERYRCETGDDATTSIHPLVRSAEACYVSTARAVELADRYEARLNVCHVTTARELTLFGEGPISQKKITAEVCTPHLWFSADDYARLGNRIKCNPSIKSPADRDALRAGLLSGRLDLVATDHAPHTAAEKSLGYWNAPSGIPSVQHSLPVMFTLAELTELTEEKPLPLELAVEKMCHAPAVRFGLANRGFLRKGYKADITIVDPASSWGVSPENILSKCGWSPWEGVRFRPRVVCTIVGGRIAWDGTRVTDLATGESLTFK
jgi:dihydroorotase